MLTLSSHQNSTQTVLVIKFFDLVQPLQTIFETILVSAVYDCTNQDSLKNSLKWLDKVKKLNNKNSLSGVLVGAKS